MVKERENARICVYELIRQLNRSDFRKKSIPQELVSGWPCIHRLGQVLCMTVPYFARRVTKEGTFLYPIYCSVTIPVRNPERVMDFTLYPLQSGWGDVDYNHPVGRFPHPALGEGITQEEYRQLCQQLYGYYDDMVEAVEQKQGFQQEQAMGELFSRLMEPGQYQQYLRINQKFYSFFCRLK